MDKTPGKRVVKKSGADDGGTDHLDADGADLEVDNGLTRILSGGGRYCDR
jgi:hypothetical protein